VQPADARIYYYASSHHIIGQPSLAGNLAARPIRPTATSAWCRSCARSTKDSRNGSSPARRRPTARCRRSPTTRSCAPTASLSRAIPGVSYTGLVTTFPLLDWGPQYKPQDETGIPTQVPPAYLGKDYAILVPQVDADGNDVAGIRSIDVVASTATNTGWNLTNKPGVIDQGGLFAAYFPYKKTQAERVTAGDPRPSLTSATARRPATSPR
jgi:hypothetical protein